MSGIASKDSILRIHLVPQFGAKKLDAITTEDVQALKHHLVDRSNKTTNNVLTVLNTLLKKAVEWDVIERMPCTIRLSCGEIIALEWTDVDLRKRQLCVQRADWHGHVSTPKSGRLRYVPMTARLTAAVGTTGICDRRA